MSKRAWLSPCVIYLQILVQRTAFPKRRAHLGKHGTRTHRMKTRSERHMHLRTCSLRPGYFKVSPAGHFASSSSLLSTGSGRRQNTTAIARMGCCHPQRLMPEGKGGVGRGEIKAARVVCNALYFVLLLVYLARKKKRS